MSMPSLRRCGRLWPRSPNRCWPPERGLAGLGRCRTDRTIDVALATVRDLALFLDNERGKQDWSTVDVADIEEFLNLQPNNRPRRLTVLCQFFRFARARRLLLVDPTRGLARRQPRGFRAKTLTIDRQRLLFRRWSTDPTVHPHEALVGSWPFCMAPHPENCGCCGATPSTSASARSALTVVLTRCRWTPPAGRS
jgi:hypothetical protein